MKIRVIACCKNEEEMLPFFLQHYSMFADEILIFDGGSTDNSHEIIAANSKAKLYIKNEPEMDERNLTYVRNEAYKVGRENWDWQIIVDIDEFVCHPFIRYFLEAKMLKGFTIATVKGFDMYSLEFPKFDPARTIVDQIKTGKSNDQWQSKRCVFNPAKVDINYEFGCHNSRPTGDVIETPEAEIFLLHYNYCGYDHFIKRHKFNAARMSKFNKTHNLAYHIPMFSTMTRKEFEKKVATESEPLSFI